MRYGFNISKKKTISSTHAHMSKIHAHIPKIMWLKVETYLALRNILCMQINSAPSMSNSMLALQWRKLGRTLKLAMGTKVLYASFLFFSPHCPIA